MAPLIPFNSQKISIKKRFIHWSEAELDRIDMVFSTYKEDSEISKINYCRTTAECDGFLLMENTPSADEFKYLLYEIGEKIYEDSNQAFLARRCSSR